MSLSHDDRSVKELTREAEDLRRFAFFGVSVSTVAILTGKFKVVLEAVIGGVIRRSTVRVPRFSTDINIYL